MAISVMLIMLVPILPSCRGLEPSLRPSRLPDPILFSDQHRRKPSIRQQLLDNFNTFSHGNDEKLEILAPSSKYYKYPPKSGEIYRSDGKNQELVMPASEHDTSVAQLSRQKIPKSSEKNNTVVSSSRSQQQIMEIADDWRKIRERRLRFYKAFRKIQDLHRKRQKQNGSRGEAEVKNIVGNTNKTMAVSHRRKKNGESSIDPTNATFNDWETFITDYSRIMPQYNRRSTTAGDYSEITGMSNQLQKENESSISGPPGYLPPIRIAQASGTPAAEHNPFDYQQLLTNLNTIRETVPGGSDGSERLPPPPNPRSTEASVHTVQVYPPHATQQQQQQQQQLSAMDYQSTGVYQNSIPSNGKYYRKPAAAAVEQSRPQLMTNEYDEDMMDVTEADPGCTTDPCEFVASADAEPLSGIASEEERCNSPRLKQMILQNIVERDAEASKRLIYGVCEAEMGVPCNVICGTGFYSYIARATHFCLAAALDVSCYAFVPACADLDSNFAKKRLAKSRRVKKT